MTQDLFHEVHTSLCWCSLPHSSAHSKHSSHLHRYLVHQLWWFLHTLIVEQGWCFLGAPSWRLHMRCTLSTNPRSCRWRVTQQSWHFTWATPCCNIARAFNLLSFDNALMGKENFQNCRRRCPKRPHYQPKMRGRTLSGVVNLFLQLKVDDENISKTKSINLSSFKTQFISCCYST